MKKYTALTVLGLTLGLSRIAAATCTGAGDPCNAPRNGSITGRTATTLSESVQNSAAPNTTNSIYFFQATTLGAAQNNGTLDRNTVIVFTADFNSPALPSDIINQTVKPLLANTAYNGFAKACPPGSSSPTDGGCSAWVAIGSLSTALLTNVGFNNITSADTDPLQFTARTNTSVADQTNVIAWLTTQLASIEVGNCALSKNLQPFPQTGAASLTITSSDCGTLVPNRPYTLTEHLVYDPTQAAPNYVSTTFYTQAADPAAGSITSVTHCSAHISFSNAQANPGNPSDTTYNVCASGTGGQCATQVIGGTGQAGDSNAVDVVGLIPGTAYTANVTAKNRGGSSWADSAAVNIPPGFTTKGTSGVFTISGITTTGADFNFPAGFDTSGAVTWQVLVNGNPTGPSGSGLPPGTIAISGLNPNTQYSIRIQINEASCNYTVPATAVQFYTLPAAPTGGSLSAPAPRQLSAGWTDANPPAGNPNGSQYTVQTCTDAGFSTGCNAQTSTKANTSPSANITASIVPETPYFVRVKTVSASGTSANDSAWLSFGTATTPNEAPVVGVVTVTPHTTSVTLADTATDNGGPTHLVYHWAVTTSPAGSTFGFTSNDTTGASATTDLTFDTLGTYAGTLTVTDHDNAGGAKLSTVVNWNSNGTTQTPTKIGINPTSDTVITGAGNAKPFAAIVCDQFETGTCDTSSTHKIPGQTVNWSMTGAGSGTLTPANPAATVSFTGVTPGLVTLSATLPGVSGPNSGTATITVKAAGPVFDSLSFAMSTGNKGGTLSATGHDNVVLSITNNYSASDSGVTFTPVTNTGANGVPATTAVTFPRAGTFTLTDDAGSGVSSSTVVVVPQDLDHLVVCAAGDARCSNTITLKTLQDQQFTASGVDQFGNPKTLSTVQWDNVNSQSGASASFSSPTLGQNIKVTATDPATGKTGFIIVNVISYDVSGAVAYPVPFKSTRDTAICFRGLGSDAHIRIFTTSGRKVFEQEVTPTAPGGCEFSWNVKNSSGESVASGVYFYVVESPQGKKNGKLIIIQ